MSTINKIFTRTIVTGLAVVTLVACSDDDNEVNNADQNRTFEVSVTNLTAGQPLSPLLIVAHNANFRLFELGETATIGMEQLAEAGDNTSLIAEVTATTDVISTASGQQPIGPGQTDRLTFGVPPSLAGDIQLSAATMLVNTNDAFTAIRNMDLNGLAVGSTVQAVTISYDSGTEANSELAGTMPGPADGGEGFNAARDDIADEIRGHPGVLTADNGLADSTLTEVARWDNPVARITIRRTQ